MGTQRTDHAILDSLTDAQLLHVASTLLQSKAYAEQTAVDDSCKLLYDVYRTILCKSANPVDVA